jgi:hypothetical protein
MSASLKQIAEQALRVIVQLGRVEPELTQQDKFAILTAATTLLHIETANKQAQQQSPIDEVWEPEK